MEYICKIESPVGTLTVSSDGSTVLGLWIEGQKYFAGNLGKDCVEQDLPVFESVRKWLDCYFSGKEPDFMPPLKPKGNPFQKSIWNILCEIPFGAVITYGDIAKQIAARQRLERMSAQAVGGAVGHNPISILIPCHRVVGSNGSLTGYAGGIGKKVKLLTLEGLDMTKFFIPDK
ncbi:methylated-DNA--protein-cysteine methyltransferase [Bacteroidia bacterium]|nr:methylated-DNA--protein-cysteine methyltransferase [Bacteroidia bacterium]